MEIKPWSNSNVLLLSDASLVVWGIKSFHTCLTVFIIFIAIDEQCLVPLTHWEDSESLFLKQSKYIYTLELKDFALALPILLVQLSYRKANILLPLTNFSNNRLRPARQPLACGEAHVSIVFIKTFLRLIMKFI